MKIFLYLIIFFYSYDTSTASEFVGARLFNEIENTSSFSLVAIPKFDVKSPHYIELDLQFITELKENAFGFPIPEEIKHFYKPQELSTLVIFEDHLLLPQINCWTDTIKQQGKGATHVHKNGNIYFSSLDNTDPRINKRRYFLSSALLIQTLLTTESARYHLEDSHSYIMKRISVLDEISSSSHIDRGLVCPLTEGSDFPYHHNLYKINIFPFQGHAFGYGVPQFLGKIVTTNTSFKIILLENGKPLTQVNCWTDTIKQQGKGATHVHKNGNIYFASSDNTNPQNNPYKYTLALTLDLIEKAEERSIVTFPTPLGEDIDYSLLENDEPINFELIANSSLSFKPTFQRSSLFFVPHNQQKMLSSGALFSKFGKILKVGNLRNPHDSILDVPFCEEKRISKIYENALKDTEYSLSTSPKIHCYNPSTFEYLAIELPAKCILTAPQNIQDKLLKLNPDVVKVFLNISTTDFGELLFRPHYYFDAKDPTSSISSKYVNSSFLTCMLSRLTGEAIKVCGMNLVDELYSGVVNPHGNGEDIVCSPNNFKIDIDSSESHSIVSLTHYEEKKPSLAVAVITYHFLLNIDNLLIPILRENFNDLSQLKKQIQSNGMNTTHVFYEIDSILSKLW